MCIRDSLNINIKDKQIIKGTKIFFENTTNKDITLTPLENTILNGGKNPIIIKGFSKFYIESTDGITYTLIIEMQSENIVTQLNTLYHGEKMKQENVYDDYISYMDEKTSYDKQQRKLEQDRQLAYEQALKENPELTYEEFMSVQPMLLNIVEEPQPSQALQKFMDKYL